MKINLYQCDRCDVLHAPHVSLILSYETVQIFGVPAAYDLCGNCWKEFRAWVKATETNPPRKAADA